MFRNIELGSYNPVFRAISVNTEEIKKYNPRMQHFIQELVWRHETTHWEQLNSSTAGHLMTSSYLFRRYTVRNALLHIKRDDKNFPICKPFYPYIENTLKGNLYPHLDIAMRGFLNDITSLETLWKYFNNEYSINELLRNWVGINQGLFSFYDLYIERVRPFIEESEDVFKLIENNKQFWNALKNFEVPLDVDAILFPSFTELVECGAQLAEYKFYLGYKRLIEANGMPFVFNGDWLINSYVEKVAGIFGQVFNIPTFNEELYDVISKIIFISLNPPVIPHFKSCWTDFVYLEDIHPGMRYYQICLALGLFYDKNINLLLKDESWDIKSQQKIGMPTSNQLAIEVNTIFKKVKNRMDAKFEQMLNTDKPIGVIDSELLLYNFLVASELRGKYQNYFINSSPYSLNPELFQDAIEINKKFRCPVLFNNEISKFQINLGGIKGYSINLLTGENQVTVDTTGTAFPFTEDVAINCIREGIHFELDNQLLYGEGGFHFDFLKEIDAEDSLLQEMLSDYERANNIQLKKIVFN